MNYTIREILKEEYSLLENFLYEAIFVPEKVSPPPKTIINKPELQIYLKDSLIIRVRKYIYFLICFTNSFAF